MLLLLIVGIYISRWQKNSVTRLRDNRSNWFKIRKRDIHVRQTVPYHNTYDCNANI